MYKIPEKTKQEAVMMIAAQEPVKNIVKQTGISERRIYEMREALAEGNDSKYEAACRKYKKEFVVVAQDKIRLLVDAIAPDKISRAALSQISMTLGILYDKVALASGEATEITKDVTQSKAVKDARNRLEELLEARN